MALGGRDLDAAAVEGPKQHLQGGRVGVPHTNHPLGSASG